MTHLCLRPMSIPSCPTQALRLIAICRSAPPFPILCPLAHNPLATPPCAPKATLWRCSTVNPLTQLLDPNFVTLNLAPLTFLLFIISLVFVKTDLTTLAHLLQLHALLTNTDDPLSNGLPSGLPHHCRPLRPELSTIFASPTRRPRCPHQPSLRHPSTRRFCPDPSLHASHPWSTGPRSRPSLTTSQRYHSATQHRPSPGRPLPVIINPRRTGSSFPDPTVRPDIA
jgi:hypothetical protein